MELYFTLVRYLRYPRRSHAHLCLFRECPLRDNSGLIIIISLTSQCVMIALVGFGAGGNLPVDGTMFLEFIPGNKQYLLTFLSIWWAVGQVVASLIAVSLSVHGTPRSLLISLQWVFIANYGCIRRECFWKLELNLRRGFILAVAPLVSLSHRGLASCFLIN